MSPSIRELPAVLVLWLIAAAGCNTTAIDLETADHDIVIPVFRASVPLHSVPVNSLRNLRYGWTAAEAPSEDLFLGPGGGMGTTAFIDFEFSYGNGKSNQFIPGGNTVNFNRVNFAGPTTVTADYELYHGSITGRGGWTVAEILRFEAIVGVGFQNVELEVWSGAQRDFDASLTGGPLLGAKASIEPFPWLAVYAQASNTFGFGDDYANLGAAEVGAAVSPLPGLTVLAGYRWWYYKEERETFTADASDVQLDLFGPVIGLQLTF